MSNEEEEITVGMYQLKMQCTLSMMNRCTNQSEINSKKTVGPEEALEIRTRDKFRRPR
jgi:hypothetical protein